MPDLTDHRNLRDAFAAQVARQPEATALTMFRGSDAEEQESLSFAELARRAALRAARLTARFAPGERVLIALPTCTQFVELYLACLFSGLIAVPTPPLGGSATATERAVAIAADCTPALVVTTADHREALAERLAALGLDGALVEAAGEAGDGEAAVPTAPDLPPDTLGVLQYSSGSTGRPKGVMLSHRNILTNIRSIGEYFGLGDGPGGCGSWLPLHHDMGLFGMLTTPLMAGAPVTLMSPSDFVRRPVEYLRMMQWSRSTVTAVPDFALDLCTRLVNDRDLAALDLSHVRRICNGSEPVHAATLEAFTERFTPAGLRPDALSPCYGMAEVTLYVSGTRLGTPSKVFSVDRARLEDAGHPEVRQVPEEQGRPLVALGAPHGIRVRIVDPADGLAVADGAIGEIWVSGPSVGSGYWERPDLNDQVFGARLPDEPGTAWLRTGDLGALVDGEVVVTGRLKEVMIVRGRNLFPQDVEREARAAHQALTGFVGAAFGIAAPDERVVVVHEVSPTLRADDLPAVAGAVQRRLSTEADVPCRNVLLVRRGTVSRTTSGKIQRTAMRERFLAGELTVLHAELDPQLALIARGGAA
ncbi:fatty acyl-AMP ligase [Kitasatospora sp. NPDC057500]|uniref:fatty acyl-AMP ligase n=1 Tax=Kitasatospora sp. NPDC057500 TaxID=3346151 RepID=UPI0036A4F630